MDGRTGRLTIDIFFAGHRPEAPNSDLDNADFQESSPGESFVPATSGLWHAEMRGIDDSAPARRSMNA
jgi:hypothetical protein